MQLFKYIFNAKYRKNKNFRNELKNKFPKSNIKPKEIISLENIKFGKYNYGEPLILRYGNIDEGLEIGNYVSIAKDVVILLGGAHNTDTITTFPVKPYFSDKKEEIRTKKTIIEDDVWIGYGAKILSGVKIGKGAVIGAGAVVTNDLEAYGIYGGVPARLIRYRFSKEIIEKLKKIDLDNLKESTIKSNIELFYEKLTLQNIDYIIKRLDLDNSDGKDE